MTLNKASLNLEIGDNDVNSLPILFQDLILSGKKLCMKVKEWQRNKEISLTGDNIFQIGWCQVIDNFIELEESSIPPSVS